MKREPVTIGDRTYVYDLKLGGWFDRDSGKLAKHISHSLVKTLDQTSPEIPDRLKEIKDKISNSNSVYLAGDEYSYDPIKGWVSERTGFPAPPSIKQLLDKNVKNEPESNIERPLTLQIPKLGIFGDALTEKSNVKNKNPVVKNDIQKINQSSLKATQPTKVENNNSDPIRGTIVSIINHVAAIDSYLRQKYLMSKSTTLTSVSSDIDYAVDPKKLIQQEDDKRSMMLPILLGGALALFTGVFDPIKQMIEKNGEMFKGLTSTFFDTIEILNEGMGSFLTKVGKDPLEGDKKFDGNKFETEIIEGGLGETPPSDATQSAPAQSSAPGPTHSPQITPSSPFVNKGPRVATPVPKPAAPSLPSQNSAYSKIQEVTKTKPATPVEKPAITSNSGFANPVDNMVLGKRGFGVRWHPILQKQSGHFGQDIPAARGTPIKAVSDGVVIQSGFQYNKVKKTGWGNYVTIKHNDGTLTRYAHMDKRMAAVGDKVNKGQQIGTVGSTGGSTGPHLHFEVLKNGKAVDPKPYLQGTQTLSAGNPDGGNLSAQDMSSSSSTDATEEKKEPISISGKIKSIWDAISDFVAFDTEYKPFVQTNSADSGRINQAAKEKHKAVVDSKSANLLVNVMNANDKPNMNKEGGSVKVPIATNDDKIIRRYLEHFDLVD